MHLGKQIQEKKTFYLNKSDRIEFILFLFLLILFVQKKETKQVRLLRDRVLRFKGLHVKVEALSSGFKKKSRQSPITSLEMTQKLVKKRVFSLVLASGAQLDKSLFNSSHHGLLRLSDPDTGVVVLFVGLVLALGVSDLPLEVPFFGLIKVFETLPVRPLGVCVNVHLFCHFF